MGMPQLSEAAELAIENIAMEILDIECLELRRVRSKAVSYTHLRAHET